MNCDQLISSSVVLLHKHGRSVGQ